MSTKKFKIFKILSATLFVMGGLVWAQVKNAYENNFQAENEKRLGERQKIESESRKNNVEIGRYVSKTIVADEDPGTTGLNLINSSAHLSRSLEGLISITYSTLRSAPSKGRLLTSAVISEGIGGKKNYVFTPGLSVDPGYIADPFWMENILVMKSGRYDSYNSYSLYALDENKKSIFRVTPARLRNENLVTSPDNKRLAYIVGGGVAGPDHQFAGTAALELWVWDSKSNVNIKIATSDYVHGSYYWKSSSELVYSVSKIKEGIEVSFSYVWNYSSRKSTLLFSDCQSPVFSPDGKYVLFATRIDKKKSFSNNNSQYVLTSTSGNYKSTIKLEKLSLGRFDFNRQVQWSPNSKFLFSVLKKPTQSGHRVFIYDTTNSKNYSYALIKTGEKARILGMSQDGKKFFVLRQQMMGESTNSIGEFNWGFLISEIDSFTGKEQIVWSKNNILSVSENGIILKSNQ